MTQILITNDDGIDSPTLGPLTRALEQLGTTRVVVPDKERSWIGKAVTRYGEIRAADSERDERTVTGVGGTPADCVSLAVHNLGPPRPDLVVSGINMGLNYGMAFLVSSGTIGAATEASIAGIPAVAFSMALPGDALGVKQGAEHTPLSGRATQAAAVAREITETIIEHGLPDGIDVISVNMPADVTPATPRRITRISRSRYGRLFERSGDGFVHRFDRLEVLDPEDNGDIAIVDRGEVSIAPIHFDVSASVPRSYRDLFERKG